MQEIILSKYPDLEGTMQCHVCGGTMLPCTLSSTFPVGREKLVVSNIKAYRCTNCQEIVYPASEAQRIEDALLEGRKGEEGA